MSKFFNVVINEYIKMFAKISTKIMLGCIVILCIGFNAIMFFAYNQDIQYTENYDYSMDIDTIMSDLAEYGDTSGYEYKKYEFLKEIGVNQFNDWRFMAADSAYTNLFDNAYYAKDEAVKAEFTKTLEAYKKAISDNDAKAYLRLEIASVKANKSMLDAEKENMIWGYQYQIDHDIVPSASLWKHNSVEAVVYSKNMILQIEAQPVQERNNKDLAQYKETAALNEYRLNNDIAVYVSENDNQQESYFWSVFGNSTKVMMVVSILIIIIAGSMVASEFSAGTIKFLLINPIRRGKILAAKYVSILTAGVVMILLYYLLNLLLGGLCFGFGDIAAPVLSVSNGAVVEGSGMLHMLWRYALGSVGVLAMATFAFAVSSLVRNSSLAIALGVALMISGYGAVYIVAQIARLDWMRYILFANTDINLIIGHNTPFLGQTVGFALIVTAVYLVVFLLTAWDAFVRRDVR